MADNISKVNGMNLSTQTNERLQSLLENEMYQDIDSEFAKELVEELKSRAKANPKE